jgi:hypothetical protein
MNNEDIDLLDPEVSEEEANQESNPHNIQFWKVKRDQDTKAVKDVIINHLQLLQVFRLMGFLRLDIDDAHLLVKIENSKVIKQVSITLVIDAFFDFLDKKPFWIEDRFSRNDLKEKFLKSMQTYFKEDKFNRLKPFREIKFNQDTRTEKYFYFKNGFVKITKDGHTFNDYSKLENFIWESEILKRNYTVPVKAAPGTINVAKFDDFIIKICQASGADTDKRYLSMQLIIGYLLHSYTDCKLTAILLTDSKISEDGEANGRTGKTLFTKSLGYMLSSNPEDLKIKTFVDVNGKDFDPKEKHKYQNVGYETKIVCLNDIKRFFDVDCVYNDVTEGVTVERKNLTPFKVKAKMILTTNKTVKIEGDSSKDRFLEFEFSDFFSKSRTPEMVYKQWFFRDWDLQEWALYHHFMFECCQLYFKHGSKLQEPEQINLNIRKLKENTSPEFIDFMEDQAIEFDHWYDKKKLFTDFITRYEDFGKQSKKFDQAKFTNWMKLYTKYNPDFTEFKKATDEKRSNTEISICFRKAKIND